MRRTLFLFLALLWLVPAAVAGGPVTWSFEQVTGADGQVQVLLKATCEEGWHIYALTLARDDGPIPTAIRVNASPDHTAASVIEPTPEEAFDPNFEMVLRYHSNVVVFTVPVQPIGKAPFTVSGEVEFMACNDKTCLPPVVVPFSVTVPAP